MNIITSGKMDSYFFALYIEKQFDIDEINFHKLTEVELCQSNTVRI